MTTNGNAHKNCRIVFFGTPDFAVHSLAAVVEAGYVVVGVVTVPDRQAGRGKKLSASAVKAYAEIKQLPLLQPQNLKDPQFIQSLEALRPDLMIVVAFRMLPPAVWQIPPLGTFNLHASLLPHYRGAAPIHWAVINQETESGVTTFLIDEQIDTGALLLQETIPIALDETTGSLHAKMAQQGSQLVLKTIPGLIDQTIQPQQQQSSGPLRSAPKLTKENTQINWHQPLTAICAQVRGLDPYPGAWTRYSDGQQEWVVKIWEADLQRTEQKLPLGTIHIDQQQIRVAHPEGWLICQALQFPNKRRLGALALLNGYNFPAKARFLL